MKIQRWKLRTWKETEIDFKTESLNENLSKLNGNILIKKTFTSVCLLVGISLLVKSIKSF